MMASDCYLNKAAVNFKFYEQYCIVLLLGGHPLNKFSTGIIAFRMQPHAKSEEFERGSPDWVTVQSLCQMSR
jgi:hypothetical protein